MPEFRKRRTRAELILRLTGLAAGALALLFFAAWSTSGAWHMYEKLRDATDQSDAASSELALLQKQDVQVKGDIANLSSARGVEAALRERYGVVKPGEGVIEIVEAPLSASSSAGTSAQGLLGQIFHTLFAW